MDKANVEPPKSGGITRRKFVGAASAAAAALASAGALSGCSPRVTEADAAVYGNGTDPFADCETVYGCCSPECQHHSLKGYVRDGKLVKVEAGEVNESGICPRGIARKEMVASSKRLTMPLRRTGEKGSGQFEETSWDEAIEEIATKIEEAVASDGSKSIAYTTLSGNFSSLTMGVPDAFFSWIGDGCTSTVDNLCCAGIDAGMTPILGSRALAIRDEFVNSDYIIAWGNNPAVSLGGYFERFEEMVAKGGTLCTIDPFYSETANRSQEWLQVYPSSDVALGLHMINTIVNEKLYDADFLRAHTTAACLVNKAGDAMVLEDSAKPMSYRVINAATGELASVDDASVTPALSAKGTPYEGTYSTVFDLICANAAKIDDETLERECGISAEDAKRVARGYVTAEHGMIIQNMGGFQRTQYGGWACAVGIYLALFTGNIGHHGDGVYDAGGIAARIPAGTAFEVNENVSEKGKLHKTHIGEQVLEDDPYKINMLFVAYENMMAQSPNTNMVKKAFEKIPFVVTVDMFMTATCLYSDIVLPCTAVFETENVTASVRSNVISISEAKITPPGEAKSDLEIARMLAERLGFGEKFSDTPAHYIDKVLEPYNLTYDELKERKAVDMRDPEWIAYKDGKFDTDSGRAELFCTEWQKSGFPAIVEYRRTDESILNATKYPLACAQRKSYRTVHTTFSELESMQKLFDEKPPIIINNEDAADRGIATGDTVTVFNDRGEHTGLAKVTSHVKKGVVIVENGWQQGYGSSSNNITNNMNPTLGYTNPINSTLVDVRKGE